MSKNSVDAYGANGKSNLLYFDPEVLHLVIDEASPLYDPRVHLPVDEALAKNIDFHGVLEPILFQKDPETGNVDVVVGRQRVKAARLVNAWRAERGNAPLFVPGYLFNGTRKGALGAIISENELRQSDTPIEKANKMRRLAAMGYDDVEVSVIFGIGVAGVASLKSLLDCCLTVQEAIDSGRIGLTHAKALAKLEPAEQREKVAALIAAGEGVKPHERAKKQRAIIAPGKSIMKTRKEIRERLAESVECGLTEEANVLHWVLGE